MGFFDVLETAYKGLEKATDKLESDVERYKERYDHYDDERLKKALRGKSGAEAIAIQTLLRERGY